MSHVFVIKPGEQHRLPEVAEEAKRLQAEVLAIEALGDESKCRVCTSRPATTREHAPSKKAGNKGRMLHGRVNYERSVTSGWMSWEVRATQGNVFESLCGTCNNNTGSWYNPAYVKFSGHCEQFAKPENVGQPCTIQIEVHPQRVLKQALTSLLAVSQPGLTTKFPHLRDLVVGKEVKATLAPVRLWLYLRANQGGRSSGLGFWMNYDRKKGQLIAEFSFGPLGWLLTLDDLPVDGAVDVSAWSEAGYHDKTVVNLAVPCQWAIGPYPADFRPPSAFGATRQ